jgi:hypothetical protein
MAEMPAGVDIDRSGEVPKRTDSRSVMKMLHDELAQHFSAKDRTVNNGGAQGKQVGLMDAVDEAVTGAPAPGAQEY